MELIWKEHGLTQSEYEKIVELMGRNPNYVELSLFGVMWSEHCSYKNSKAQLRKFPTEGPQVLQGPGENAGVIDLGDGIGVSFKLESHNHPSAIEPYQGAATGVGGIIRDIFAMGARPIALLDSLRFGELKDDRTKGLFRGVVAGISGYGNCIGIPTVAGETYFHPSYQGNPLVNAMCVGILKDKKIFTGAASGVGNIVMVVGALTGRDGIKGASFASEELNDKDPDKRPAVQVGDPFMEKLLLEASLEVLEKGAVIGLQDLGAAGLTSSAVEMAGRAQNGLYIDVEKVPLREAGMEPWEIMLSESQERMLLVVKPEKVSEIKEIFDKWDLTAAEIGKVTDDGLFKIVKNDEILASISAELLTDKAPVNIRESKEPDYFKTKKAMDVSILKNHTNWLELVKMLLNSPNIASKAWIYEQYDHMVGINTVIRPGGDAAVLRIPESKLGMALTVDCNSRYVYLDPWRGGAIAVAEAARNIACSGGKPIAITNCLNFGNPEKPEIYWQLSNAIDGIAEACRQFDTPVTGGNVSLYNEYNGEAIFPTPTIGMVGKLDDVEKRVESGFQQAGDIILLIGETLEEIGASEALYLLTGEDGGEVPNIDFVKEKALHQFLYEAANQGLLQSAHDCSEGGMIISAIEAAMISGFGIEANWTDSVSESAMLVGESQSRAIISVTIENLEKVSTMLKRYSIEMTNLGQVQDSNHVVLAYNNKEVINSSLSELTAIWKGSLPCLMK